MFLLKTTSDNHDCRPSLSHQNIVQVGSLYWHNPLGAHAHGDVIEQGLRELLLDGQNVLQGEVRPHQSDAAVDVKAYPTCWVGVRQKKSSADLQTDARGSVHKNRQHLSKLPGSCSNQSPRSARAHFVLTRRHDRIRVPHVERGDVSDGESVPRVHVGQADGALTSSINERAKSLEQ